MTIPVGLTEVAFFFFFSFFLRRESVAFALVNKVATYGAPNVCTIGVDFVEGSVSTSALDSKTGFISMAWI